MIMTTKAYAELHVVSSVIITVAYNSFIFHYSDMVGLKDSAIIPLSILLLYY